MANLPLQDGYETQLAQSWNGATGTIYVLETPVYTPKTTPTIITVNPGKTNAQLAVISDYDATAKTLTVSAITPLYKAKGVLSTAQSHGTGSKVIISDNYEFWKDLATRSDDQTFTGDLTFDGDATFNGVMNFSNIGDVNVNGKSNPAPVVADTTARDALYPSPVTGDMAWVTALNALQIYNTATAQWDTQDVGTPAPVATESVQGIMKLHAASADPKAIVSEEAGTSGTAVSASNKLVDNADTATTPTASKIVRYDTNAKLGADFTPDTTYPAGETLSAGNVVFIENAPTTAQATSAQNIGDVAANTRVSFPVFGSGVAGTTTKLNLAKVGSPSVAVQVRIETDNAGSPSGTLIHANATGTVAAASLGTVILGDATETGATLSSTTSQIAYVGYRILANGNLTLTSVNKATATTATKCYLKNDAGTILQTVAFSGNVATFSYALVRGTYYRIEVGADGASYTYTYNGSASYPYNRANLNFITGSQAGADNSNAHGVETITTLTNNADTVTLGGSFTIPAGQKCHQVVSQVSDTVNASNYYKIGYYTNDTSTRKGSYWNGSTWTVGTNSAIDNSASYVAYSGGFVTYSAGHRILATTNCVLKTITKHADTNATRCRIYTDAGSLLDTATFSGNVATFSMNQFLASGTYYRIEADASGASYNRNYDNTAVYPVASTHITFVTGSQDQVNTGSKQNIISMQTVAHGEKIFPYTSSTLFTPRVLSKTDADYSYKIDWHGISQEAVTAGDLTTGKFPKIAISGIDSNQTGMTQGATQYLGNTAGSISASAGTNSKKLGKAISDTKIKIVDIPL